MTNLFLNPGFETPGAGGADVFADWIEVSSVFDETGIVHSGSHSAWLWVGGSVHQSIAHSDTTVGLYKLTVYARGTGSGSTLHIDIQTTCPTISNFCGTEFFLPAGVWTKCEFYFESQPTVTALTPYLGAGGLYSLYIDDASLELVETRPPFVTNGDFSTWRPETGFPKAWTIYQGLALPANAAQDSDVYHSPPSSARMEMVGPWSAMMFQLYALPEGVWRLSLFFKPDGTDTEGYFEFWIEDLGSPWNYAYEYLEINSQYGTEWQVYQLTYTSPAAGAAGYLMFWEPNAPGKLWVDDFEVDQLLDPLEIGIRAVLKSELRVSLCCVE